MYVIGKKGGLWAFIFGLFLLPLIAFATPSSVDRITDHIQPLILGDYIKAQYYIATSTTVASMLPYASTTALSISGLTSGRCVQTSTGGLLTITGSACGGGSVTSVTGTYPVLSSGGSTPAISLAFGTTTANTWSLAQTFTLSPIFSTLGAGVVNATAGGSLYSAATTTLSGNSQIAISNSPVVIGASGSVASIVADSIGNAQLAFDTGQTLTTAGTPTFAGLTVTGLSGCVNATAGVLGSTGSACGAGSGGLATSSPVSGGNLLEYSAAGAGSAFGVATGTVGVSGPITVTAGQSIIGSGLTIGCTTASNGVAGCLNSSDWATFNAKQAALTATWPQILTGATLTFGGLGTSTNLTQGQIPYVTGVNTFGQVATGTVSAGSSAITVTAGRSAIGGALAIDCATASGSQNGCLSSTDWSTFNSKGSGTVTSVTATNPIFSTGGATPVISTIFSTTSTWGLGNNGLVMTGATGIPFSQATSTAIALNISGNAATVTTNANLSGVVTSAGNVTSYGSQAAGVLGNSITGNTAPMATSTLYGAVQNGKVLAGVSGTLQYVATTTNSCSLGITCTYSAGTGNNAFSISANALTLSMFPTIAANTVIGNLTGSTATPTAFATSSLFTGTVGQVGYFSGTGSLIGTSSIIIDTTSNVGIGTTTPLSLLSIYGGTAASAVNIGTADFGGGVLYSSIALNGSAGSTTGYNILSRSADPNLYINAPGGSAIKFRINNNDKVIIDSLGDMGIGTTTPFGALSVAKTSSVATIIADGFNTIAALFNTASTTGSIFTVEATTTTNTQLLAGTGIKLFDVDQYGHLMASSTPNTPTVSACGTGAPAVTTGSTDSVGSVTTGTGGPTACTITFGKAFATTPAIFVTDTGGTVTAVDVTAVSTTAFTMTFAAGLTSIKLEWFAIQGPANL